MDFDQAIRVFKLYSLRYEQDPRQAETMLLTENEKQAASELKDIIREYAVLFEKDRKGVSMGAHLSYPL